MVESDPSPEGSFFNAFFLWQNKCEAETTAEESEELLVATELVAQVQPLFAEWPLMPPHKINLLRLDKNIELKFT